MKRSRLSRWVAVLALVIAPVATPVTAEETATITITGTFKMDAFWGTVGADLAQVFANGSEHTWTATLHGVTHAHSGSGTGVFRTEIFATSFEFQFSGPDADILNAAVGDKLGGSGAYLMLVNYGGVGEWVLFLPSADPDAGVWFNAADQTASATHAAFPADADGYPVPPLQAVAWESVIGDSRDGNSGGLYSYSDTVDVTGDIGSPIPPGPATLSIGDAYIAEGDRGSRQLTLQVTLSNTSDQTVTVDYRTVDGTAVSVGGKGKKAADYAAASGTLSFQPGETAKTIAISIKSDRTREWDEYFAVQLSNAAGAPIADGLAYASILNDD